MMAMMHWPYSITFRDRLVGSVVRANEPGSMAADIDLNDGRREARFVMELQSRQGRWNIRLRRSAGLIDVGTGAAHLHRERPQQVAAACAVAGPARLL